MRYLFINWTNITSPNITSTTMPSIAPTASETPAFASDIAFASSVILTVLASLLFVAACLVLFLYYWKRFGRAVVETKIGIVIFFLGALLTTISTLGCYKDVNIYGVYRLFVEVMTGIVALLVGAVLLFESPSPEREMDDYGRPLIPIGHTHGSMGVVIWFITLPLCALEMFFAIGAATKSPAPIYAAIEFVSFTQKIIQASVYHFSLRHRVPKPLMRMGCSWFMKMMSLFNFAFWIDSIITTHTDNEFVMNLFGNGFSIVKAAYNALIIDYRLLCSLLFLEHALELEDVRDSRLQVPYDPFDEPEQNPRFQTSSSVNVQVAHYSGYGYVIGLVCIGLQLVNGLQYLGFVGVWANIFPVISDVSVVIAGLVLVSGSQGNTQGNQGKWRETESKAMDVMVGFMGAVGFIFWVMKTCFTFLWSFHSIATPSDEASQSYLIWTSVKNAVRAIGMLFQMHFFVKMGPNYCTQARNISRKFCHLLVPAIMLGLLAVFLSCVIDQYNGKVEHLIQQSKLDPAVQAFFEAAAPIHLGFSLHMFLHFFIIKRKLSLYEYVADRSLRQSVHIRPVAEHDDDGNHTDEDSRNGGEREPLLSNVREHAVACSA